MPTVLQSTELEVISQIESLKFPKNLKNHSTVDKLKPTRRQSKSWFFFGSRSKPKEGAGSTQTTATSSTQFGF